MKYTELIKLGKSPTDGDSIIQDHSSFLTHCMTPHSQDNNVRFGVKVNNRRGGPKCFQTIF